MHPRSLVHTLLQAALALACATSALCSPAAAQAYKVTNILSDGSVPATTTDAGFINPWAVSSSPTWWISAQGTGQNYVVPATGLVSFKVVVPASSGLTTATGLPSGSVTTGGTVGMILPNGTKASFLFSTLDGTISGWNSKLGTAGAISQIAINNTAAGAAYTGLAILNTPATGTVTSSYILAANFGKATAVEVYDSAFKPATLAGGAFTDPNLPAGYAPYSVHVFGSQVFVNYALRSSAGRTVDAPGNGLVDIFDITGKFVSRALTGGNLNSPWGIAFAPASFGLFSNDLLVGNFGDGKINVYDPKTFAYLGQLMDGSGKSLAYASLWELLPGGTAVTGTTAVSGGDTSTVYFSAGLTSEAHGLFAGIANATTAGSTPAFGFTASAGAATVTAGSSTSATLSLAPVNGFSGSVTLACTGLPVGATCAFAPTQLTVSANAVTTGMVTIQTASAKAFNQPTRLPGRFTAGITSALLLPFASLLLFRRRRVGRTTTLRLLTAILSVALVSGVLAGCSDSAAAPPVVTPAGQSTVTVTATAGTVTQQTAIALTVQ